MQSCPSNYAQKSNLDNHIKQHHEDSLHTEIEYEFNENDLSSNFEIDVKLGKFQCDLCTEMFSSETNLVTHQELKHDLSIGGKIRKIAEFEKQKEDFHVNIANV